MRKLEERMEGLRVAVEADGWREMIRGVKQPRKLGSQQDRERKYKAS